jgi:hypothetical protein
VVAVSPTGCHTDRGEAVTLSGQVLLVGGAIWRTP